MSEDFWKKLQDAAREKPIFYVTLDPERASGIHDIIPRYSIICPYESDFTRRLSDEGARVCVLENLIGAERTDEVVRRGTYGILRAPQVVQWIKESAGGSVPNVMLLKNSPIIERRIKELSWNILAPQAEIAEEFEQKISQYRNLANFVRFPETKVVKLSEVNEQDITKYPAVVQFNRGHSGKGTLHAYDFSYVKKLAKQFPRREAKISSFLQGTAYTLNGAVLNDGRIIAGSVSLQLTGIPEATDNPSATVGNDFSAARETLREAGAQELKKMLESVGHSLFARGYRGMFGIDAIVQKDADRVYFIEVNTHQPASVSFEAKLHRSIGCVPIFAWFLADFLGVEYKGEEAGDFPPILYPSEANQILYRNKSGRLLKREEIEAPEAALKTRMKSVKPGEEMYRIQMTNDK